MYRYFSFNGKSSKDFNLKVGYIGSKGSLDSPVLSYENQYIRTKNNNGFSLVSSIHNDPLTLEGISVVRDGCDNKFSFTYKEMMNIYNWLTSTKHGVLQIFLDDGTVESLTGMFIELKEKVLNGFEVGFDLKFKSESPYVSGGIKTLSFTNQKIVNIEIPREDHADCDYMYPVLNFKILQAGDLTIYVKNALEDQEADNTIIIKGCTLDEEIKIDSLNEIVEFGTGNEYDRFSWTFPYMHCDKTKTSSTNVFTFTLPVTGSISYDSLRIGVGLFD